MDCIGPKSLISAKAKMFDYRNGSFIHGINISQMTILVNICDFIFTNLLAS